MTTGKVEPRVSDPAPDAVTGAPAESVRPGPRWRQPAALAAAGLLMVSGLLGWWYVAQHPQPVPGAQRDAVLIAAQQDITTMNTLDYRHVEAGLKAWRSVTTGTLHDQLDEVGKRERNLLADQKKISTGKVIDAAAVSLAPGSATVIAAVEVTVRDGDSPDAKPSVKRNRFTADLVKVGHAWKLENLQQVPVNLS